MQINLYCTITYWSQNPKKTRVTSAQLCIRCVRRCTSIRALWHAYTQHVLNLQILSTQSNTHSRTKLSRSLTHNEINKNVLVHFEEGMPPRKLCQHGTGTLKLLCDVKGSSIRFNTGELVRFAVVDRVGSNKVGHCMKQRGE